MRNVSIEFLNEIQNRMDFYYSADMTFADGTTVELSPDDIVVSGNNLVESAESTSFPLGNAIGKRLTIGLRNEEDQYSEHDFYNATIQIYLKFDLSENTEIINLGKYTVRDPETYGSTITITAVDDMHKADTDFTRTDFPKTVLQGMLDCCSDCDLTLLTTDFPNADFIIQSAPTGLTNRQFIGLCAMIAGGNAVVDEYGRVKIITYDLSFFENEINYDGGIFDNNTPYSSGNELDGGTFNPWNTGDIANGGTFSDYRKYHVFYKNQSPTIATDDVQITGIRIVSNEVEYLYGTEGYVLTLENQLTAGNETEAVKRIGTLIVGLKFRPFTLDHVSYPLAEFGDLCYIIDRKNRIYKSIVTDVDFSLKGFTVLRCSADSPVRNSSKYNANATVQAVIKARKDTDKRITEYDKAVQMMTSILSNSLGMFTTIEKTENGGKIVYQHNKQNLSDSDIIWKKTENAFTVSTDGGENWNAGIDADGNAVVNVLSAIGINFDWAKGGTIELGGMNNKAGYLRVLNEKGEEIIIISNGGAYFGNGNSNTAQCEFEGEKNSVKIYPQGISLCETDNYGSSFHNPEAVDFFLNRDSEDDQYPNFRLILREICSGFRINRLIGDLGRGVVSTILKYIKDTNSFIFPEIGSFSFSKKNDFDFLGSSTVTSVNVNGNVTTEDTITVSELINGSKNGTSAKTISDNLQKKINNGYNGTVKVPGPTFVSGIPMNYITLTIENGIITNAATTTT